MASSPPSKSGELCTICIVCPHCKKQSYFTSFYLWLFISLLVMSYPFFFLFFSWHLSKVSGYMLLCAFATWPAVWIASKIINIYSIRLMTHEEYMHWDDDFTSFDWFSRAYVTFWRVMQMSCLHWWRQYIIEMFYENKENMLFLQADHQFASQGVSPYVAIYFLSSIWRCQMPVLQEMVWISWGMGALFWWHMVNAIRQLLA